MRRLKKWQVASMSLLIALISFSFVNTDRLAELSRQLDLYAEMYRSLNSSYVDDVEAGTLMKTGVDAMLKKLDPYTSYISEATIEGARLDRFAGGGNIGASVRINGDKVVFDEVTESLPAAAAGIYPGDQLIKIDGRSIDGRSIEEIDLFLKGQPSTSVTLDIVPFKTGKEESIRLERMAIRAKDVTFSRMINDSIGYVKLTSFTANCAQFVQKEIEKLQSENELKGLIFDLRYNGGGLLREAILVANLFVEKGEVVTFTKGRRPDWDNEYKAPNDPLLPDMPLAVLINGRSASASEIVSGTIQDLDRGVLIGERSFGKGLVQQTRDIGYNARVKLTVAKYFIPSGRCIQAVDYYGEYSDDGAKQIADSLVNAYTTRNGRKVFDNSGVAPDVEVSAVSTSELISALVEEGALFDYVTKFHSENDSIDAPLDFELPAGSFSAFSNFVRSGDYKGNGKKAILLAQLEKNIEKEQYAESVISQYEKLKASIDNLQLQELTEHKPEVLRLLRLEIIKRYYFQDGMVKASLSEDPNILTAIEILNDSSKYNDLLSTVL